MTIRRVWRGWTSKANAARYEEVLMTQVLPAIEARRIPGLRAFELLREDRGDEVEFSTIMTFDALENVVAFQGEDYARAHVPEPAQEVLDRWDETTRHYELRMARRYD